jgi:D-alanyl-D-alanine carboxypeptidase/D-alanyl-D-alanine-endopeptidase (penicillin-binding protein 4)
MKVKMKKLLVAAVFGISLVGTASADLTKRIDSIISRPLQKKVQFSIHIVKADSGKTVYSHNVHSAMIPASNMKVITTAAALKYLGPEYEYKTKVGLCRDTLVIIGAGDPLLGDKVTDAKYGRKAGWIFEDITEALRRNGIKTVRDIIIDSSVFDDKRVHPNWPKEQLNRWYACEVCGLNFNGNCIEIHVKTVGGKVTVSVEPQTNYVQVINKVVPVSKGKNTVGAYRQREPNRIVVHGRCNKAARPFDVAIERPAAFFGYLLVENLRRAGIKAEGRLIEKEIGNDYNVTVLGEYTSSMADCLARCHKNSFGLAAESLLKTIAANSNESRKNGSWQTGRKVISKYLASLGIGQSEFYIDDASGLSRQNELSANAVTRVLRDVYKSRNWKLYKDSLAVGGLDGTIRRYFKEEKYKGKVLGKTGFISGVKTFSGMCSTNTGDYIFSILANNANGKTRKAINDIAKAIIDNADM